MEIGQKVRVIDNGMMTAMKQPFIGRKGKIKAIPQEGEGAYVVFKSGSALCFTRDQLELVKNRHPFDLERALKGEEVIDRRGRKVIKIEVIGKSLLRVEHNDDFYYHAPDGTCNDDCFRKLDLFMKHPAKAEQEPVQITPEFVKEFNELKVEQPVNDYGKLKSTFTELLQAMYERSNKGTCPKWEGMCYWNEKAGLTV